MIAEIGLIFLIFSILFSLVTSIYPSVGFLNKNWVLQNTKTLEKLTNLIFFCILLSFICLTHSFIISDFSLLITSKNSNSELPLIYKITGVWGNHEGSILLWLLVMSFFGFLFSRNKIIEFTLKSTILQIQGLLCFLVGIFVLFTSNPFERIFPPQIEGRDLNPLLQDPGLAIHPPFLYMGYVGFSIVYSIAIGGLIRGKVSLQFIKLIKPWIYLSWIFLTCGIGLGSWWAYYELGWGGFWFWDPVENASLLPWLTGTALLHTVIVAEKKEELISWTLLLSIITFSLSLLGTFLVRSGVLVSVHAFANDPERGIFILFLLVFIIGFGLTLYIKNSFKFSKKNNIELISREGAISLNNVFMLSIAGTVLIGTIYPLIADAFFEKKISVGAPFFNSVLTPFLFPLVFGMIIGPFLNWGADDLAKLVKRLKFLILAILFVSMFFWYFYFQGPILAVIFLTLSLWLAVSSIFEILSVFQRNIKTNKKPFWNIPVKIYAQSIAHLGVALLILGSTGGSLLKEEKIQFQEIGEEISLSNYKVKFLGVQNIKKDNYRADQATFDIYQNDILVTTLKPEKRYYNYSNQITTEASIFSTLLGDIYIAIGEKNINFKSENSWTTRLWFNPYVIWIWIGVFLIAFGGLISLVKISIKE